MILLVPATAAVAVIGLVSVELFYADFFRPSYFWW
jgi:hypothetical protein